MSRIGNAPVTIPSGVTITLSENLLTVKGSQGELQHTLHPFITIDQDTDKVTIKRQDDSKLSRSLHGLTRSLIANMVTGVSTGFQKRLELIGTGYRVAKAGSKITLQLGFSHPVEIDPPTGISFEVEGQNKIIIKGNDKQKVGQVAAEIRAWKKPEPYKGKGIRYEGEIVRRKAGKAAKVGTAA